MYIDVNGDSLWIAFGTNNQQKALYMNGSLLNSDGSQYSGEGVRTRNDGSLRITNSYLRRTTKALDEISATDAGSSVIDELQSSTNNFTILEGDNRFVPGSKVGSMVADLMNNAQAIPILDKGKLVVEGLPFNQIGSGGTVFWNPDAEIETITTKGTRQANSTIGLGHELFHAYDANVGMLDYTLLPINNRFERRLEARATYFGNQLRRELGLGYYRSQYSDAGASLLNNGEPIDIPPPNISWLMLLTW